MAQLTEAFDMAQNCSL